MKRPALAMLIILLTGCSLLEQTSAEPLETATLPDPYVSTDLAPNPELAAVQFLDAWSAKDYPAMYAMLSSLSQDGLSEQAFTERYRTLSLAAVVTDINHEIISSLIISPRQAQVRYRLTMQSLVAGDITRDMMMDLSRDDESWRIAWDDSLILPELTRDSSFYLDLVTPVRANIYDRNGLALAAQTDAVALWIVPNQIGDEDAESAMLSTLRRLLGFPSDESIRQLYDNIRGTNFRVVLGEVPLEDFQLVEGTLAAVGGVDWASYSTRLYLDQGLAPHSVGYISWIREEEHESYLELGYQGDEYVGQIGLEYGFEAELRGVPGGALYLSNPNGTLVGPIASKPPEPPYALYTTLDRDLQRYAQQAIEDSGLTGAVVVLDRDSGAVLAMVSSPGFDPNLFDTDNPNSATGLTELFQSANEPLLNRASQGLYPPGSVFKMITMAAALELGGYQATDIYNCKLIFDEGGFELYDWRLEKELPASGEITLIQGLERSCNPYFYHIGLDLFQQDLPTAISDMAKGFGLGQSTGIELGDAAGLVPDPDSKQALFGEDWFAGDSVELAIGQSFLLVTPLQVARYVAAIGNGGTLYQPQLVYRIQNAEGEILYQFAPIVQGSLPIRADNLNHIQTAMINVIRDPKATAYRRFLGINLNVAGKTGTASTGDFSDSHAWFTGYTFEEREDKPDIAVAVVLEFQGEGSEWAAPVFRRILEAYFKGRPQSIYPWEERLRVPKGPTPTPGPEEAEDATPEP